MELNGSSLLGRELRLDLARERGAPGSRYFSYLPYEACFESLLCMFVSRLISFYWNICSNARNYQRGEKGVGSQSKTVFVKGFDTSIGEDEVKFLFSIYL